ncbi:hypothetical protein PMAYCL1PPCAC_19983, partial [Pristionchus mayeri]
KGAREVPFTTSSTSMDPKTAYVEERKLRSLAFYAVAVSTASVIVAIVAVPMCYNYMTMVHSNMQDEVDFCIERSSGLWRRFESVRSEHANISTRWIDERATKALSRESRMLHSVYKRQQIMVTGIGTYDAGGAAVAEYWVVFTFLTTELFVSGGGGRGSCCSCGM